MTCRYSTFVVESFVKVAVTFQGLVETYKRGDAGRKWLVASQAQQFRVIEIRKPNHIRDMTSKVSPSGRGRVFVEANMCK